MLVIYLFLTNERNQVCQLIRKRNILNVLTRKYIKMITIHFIRNSSHYSCRLAFTNMAVDIICPPIIFTGLRNLHLAGRMDIINNLTDKLLGKHETELVSWASWRSNGDVSSCFVPFMLAVDRKDIILRKSRAGPKHLCDVAPLYWSTMISFLGLIGSLTLKRPEIWQIPGPGILENDYASVLAGDQRSETFTKLSGRHSIL